MPGGKWVVRAMVAAVALTAASAAHAESRPFAAGFYQAVALATDADGNVYVGDGDDVTKFSPAGATLARYPSSVGIRDVALDSAGAIYVSEWGGANWEWVRKIAPDGHTLWSAGQYLGGRGLAVADGRVYVTDVDRVKILDADTGTELTASPSLRQANDTDWLEDVETGGGRVFAATNGRVHVLDADGTPQSVVNIHQPTPWRLDYGSDGRIRVVPYKADLELYDQSWNYVGRDDVPPLTGVAEHGDTIYMLTAD